MNKLFLLLLLALSLNVNAQEYESPVLKASEVIAFIIKHEKLKKEDVNVLLLKFDYLKNKWHVELEPVNEACTDCFPSYHITNSTKPIIEKEMHG